MRCIRACISVYLLLSIQYSANSQETASVAPQAAQLLQGSLATLNGGQSIRDVTLIGPVRRIAGSEDEAGVATFKALPGTGSRLELTFSSGVRNEIRNDSGSDPVGSRSGPDGVAHPIAFHNLLTDMCIFPSLTLASFASSPNTTLTYVGIETKNGVQVAHIRVFQQHAATAEISAVMRRLTQVDILIDVATNLPVSFSFNSHPDDDAGLDIPVEVQFSEYRIVNGIRVPFHVQKFLNNGLVFDFQVQTAMFNSGLPTSTFTVSAGV